MAPNHGYLIFESTTLIAPQSDETKDGDLIEVASRKGIITIQFNEGQFCKIGKLLSQDGARVSGFVCGDFIQLKFDASSSTWEVPVLEGLIGNWIVGVAMAGLVHKIAGDKTRD